MRTLVYYHADCLDGFGAAFAAWLALGDTATFRAMHHGDRWTHDEVRNATVYILDYSFSRTALMQRANQAYEQKDLLTLLSLQLETAQINSNDLAATAPREGVAAVQGPYWMRWQSPPVTTRGELQSALAQASQWAQSPGADDRLRETALIPLADWQVFFYRNDAWTNPQSSSGTAAEALPGGVRAVLVLPAGDGLSGRLVRDWVRPNLSVSRS